MRDRAVSRIHLDVGDEQLARTRRLRGRLPWNRRVDLRAHLRVETVAAADLPRGGLQHVVDASRHRRPHDTLERLQVLHHVGLGRADRLDRNRERLEAGLVDREKEISDARSAVAKRHGSRTRVQRAAVSRGNVQKPVLDDSQTIGRLDAGLRPATKMSAHTNPFATPFERRHDRLRIALALERDVDAELLGQLVELGRIRCIRAGDDERRVDRLDELEHAPARRGVGAEVVDAIGRDRLGDLAQAIDDGRPLVRLQPLIERLRHLKAGDLRARRFDACDRPHIRSGERVGERQSLQRCHRGRNPPAEPHRVVRRSHADRRETAAIRPLGYGGHLRRRRPLLRVHGRKCRCQDEDRRGNMSSHLMSPSERVCR